jgi:hypothetical protein
MFPEMWVTLNTYMGVYIYRSILWPRVFRIRVWMFKLVDAHVGPGRDGNGCR